MNSTGGSYALLPGTLADTPISLQIEVADLRQKLRQKGA